MGARLTRHGQKRLRERAGLSTAAAMRMAARALDRGISSGDVSGNFRGYLDGLFLRRRAAFARVYGEFVFLYGPERQLITSFPVPREFRAAATKALARKAADQHATPSSGFASEDSGPEKFREFRPADQRELAPAGAEDVSPSAGSTSTSSCSASSHPPMRRVS